jgi:CheY-like chemotaxis protein
MPLPGGAQELIGATQTAARRGGLLLDKIARMSGPIEMRPAPVVLRDFLDSFAPLARAPLPPAITFDSTARSPQAVLLDAGSLQDSLLNLVLNARDAIGGRVRADHAEARRAGHVARHHSDRYRPGLRQAALDHALDPFFTTKGEGGSGLGLSMVYDMAKLAGGQVRLCQPARAAARVVTLRLPLKPAEADARPRLVMVVDDMADLRAAVRMTLTDMGHQVIEAATVDEALALSDIPGLNWVISDLRLGGEDGVSLLSTVATAPRPSATCADDLRSRGDPRRAEAAARWPVLPKPVDRVQLARLFARTRRHERTVWSPFSTTSRRSGPCCRRR